MQCHSNVNDDYDDDYDMNDDDDNNNIKDVLCKNIFKTYATWCGRLSSRRLTDSVCVSIFCRHYG